MKSEEKSGVTSPFPQTLLNQRGPAWSASNIHKYTGKAWGNHRPSASISRTITLHSVARVTRAERRRLVKRAWYREPDYTFGQLMLTLRTRIRLTQAGLAKLLGISRHAVAEWEAGRSYPTAEHLKTCIGLGVQQQAFACGRQAEEIRALWHAAHQKVLLDEAWLQRLLSQQPSPLMEVAVEPTRGADRVSTPPFTSDKAGRDETSRNEAWGAVWGTETASSRGLQVPPAGGEPRVDWGEALDVPSF